MLSGSCCIVFFLAMLHSTWDLSSWIRIKPPAMEAAAAKSRQSCPTLCDPINGSLPASAVPGILQARTLEWVVISFSNSWKWKVKVKLLSHVQLSDRMDCSLPGSSAHGIFQARVLEWDAIAFSAAMERGVLNTGPPGKSMALVF